MNKLVYNGTTKKGSSIVIYDTGDYYRVYELRKGESDLYRGSYKTNLFNKYEVIQIVKDEERRW